jgi:hypothetical protein
VIALHPPAPGLAPPPGALLKSGTQRGSTHQKQDPVFHSDIQARDKRRDDQRGSKRCPGAALR